MTVNITETDDFIEVRVDSHSFYYSDFRFHKDDLDVVIQYLKHRLRTSKARYISCYQTSFYRNKLYNKLLHAGYYRGSSLRADALSEIIDALEELNSPLTIEEVRIKLAKRKLSDILRYAKRVGVA